MALNTHQQPQQVQGTHDDAAIHVCWDCNARFTRLEHLKRHITSLHITAPKSHQCEFCSKRFSRRDVLLRHHQSCRAAKDSSTIEVDPDSEPVKRARHGSSSRPKSGGRDETFAQNQDVYVSRQKSNAQLPSPVTDRSQAECEEDMRRLISPSLNSGRQSTSPPKDGAQNSIFVSGPGGRRPSEAIDLEGMSNQTLLQEDSNSQQDLQRSRNGPPEFYFLPEGLNDDTTSTTSTKRPLEPQRAYSADGQLPKERAPANKRGRYVSNACVACQKRKVKCSGEATCFQCSSAQLVCIYKSGKKRRNTTVAREETQLHQTSKVQMAGSAISENPMKVSDSLKQMMERITSLERECNAFKSHIGPSTTDKDMSSSPGVTYSTTDSPGNSSVTSLPANELFYGGTSLMEPIDILNRTVASGEEEQSDGRGGDQGPGRSAAVTWHDLPKSNNRDLRTLEKETRMIDINDLCHSIDIFFSYLNPHYPCVNENQFRAQFREEMLSSSAPGQRDAADFYQFIALVNMIQAEVKVLSKDWADSNTVPGWNDFCRAENILAHLTWLGNGNILTIQILLIKARYLLYIEKADSAYDTMSRIVSLCYKLGLHDQPSWIAKGCSPFEIVMRQRIFWTTFYLERNVAFNCGSPYLIRETDFKVDLPLDLEDLKMFPNEPLPVEYPELSYGPYLTTAVKWGRLCSEIWDAIFGVNAQKPTSQEFVASIDARIIYTMSQFPTHLQWDKNIHRLTNGTDVPPYILRQTIILLLRMNQLRLVLRQERMLNMTYDTATAENCVTIATSSINAIYTYLSSPFHRSTDRFSSVLYLVGALLPLVCIIVKNDNDIQTRTLAISAFKKGLNLLNSMSPNFSWARHTLRRIHRIIGTAKRAIEVFDNAGMFAMNPAEFFEEDLLAKGQYADFFNMDNWVNMDKDVLMQQQTGALGFRMDDVEKLNPNFPGTGDEMDAFWVDDFLKTTRVFPGGD